jgi:hypothetical protein
MTGARRIVPRERQNPFTRRITKGLQTADWRRRAWRDINPRKWGVPHRNTNYQGVVTAEIPPLNAP